MISDDRKLYEGPNLSHEQNCLQCIFWDDLLEQPSKLLDQKLDLPVGHLTLQTLKNLKILGFKVLHTNNPLI